MLKSLDPRSILKVSLLYSTYQYIVGGIRARRLFVENDAQIKLGEKVLDIGCGPGDILKFLPKVDYTGCDMDATYIKTAKEKYPQYSFHCAGVEDFKLETPNTFDVVITTGVIHHLNNEQARTLFNLARQALKPNGRLVTFDGCYIENQNPISKKFLDMDRGNFIRRENDYVNLASPYFSSIKTKIDETYFRIPYTSIIMECKKE
ncbi:class I SAM-dependent methyltransferase [Seonamhaeicola maritimus]|uniref:class I SAM-dependent methyltransferase n=1 Tax=Seonamhaeicola maritimus TaxID=2591822 RepID=UPI002494F16E|nr:class I SAM-dependent methyltransferase [Seonamhaeicola maritimus]